MLAKIAGLLHPYQSWAGERLPFIVVFGENVDMWDQYVEMRRDEMKLISLSDDPERLPRESDQFYLDNREAMDKGFVVDDETKFYGTEAEDGLPLEYSAIQFYYNKISEDEDEFATKRELQMDPMAELEADPEREDRDWTWFQSKTSDYRRCVAPNDTQFLIFTTDCNKFELHWAVDAWSPGAESVTIDYGIEKTGATTESDEKSVEEFLFQALISIYHKINAWEYVTVGDEFEAGEPESKTLPINCFGIDGGWLTDVVYKFKSTMRDPRILVLMGTDDKYTPRDLKTMPKIKEESAEKSGVVLGWHWALRPRPNNPNQKLFHIDSNHWKRFDRNRYAADQGFGSRRFFKSDGLEFGKHDGIAKHLANVSWDPEKQRYVDKNRNHWSDRSYYSCAIAHRMGIRLMEKLGNRQANPTTVHRYNLDQKMQSRD